MIQISGATANLLTEANLSHWIKLRDNPITLKGKGVVQTYWVDPVLSDEYGDDSRSHPRSAAIVNGEASRPWGDTRPSDRLSSKMSSGERQRRMVEWNTDLLLRFLKKIVAPTNFSSHPRRLKIRQDCTNTFVMHVSPLAEAAEVLTLPGFSEKATKEEGGLDQLDLGDVVRCQLQDYLTKIASMYHDNPFHNFEHACHVAMSAAKIVMRIIQPDVETPKQTLAKGRVELKRKIHNSTFGISSDVLMQFAVVFSAVIHDVDHTGVSNAQLVKEGHDVALKYCNKCVAEQNSVDIAWNLLMHDQYGDLRRAICRSEAEQQRFRQLLVNAVIATDIADKELQQQRKNRWDRAFHSPASSSFERNQDHSDVDRKATIVFDYIIQASDVSHTMQHWKVYKQWNERLFEERYRAYQTGREQQDPSVDW